MLKGRLSSRTCWGIAVILPLVVFWSFNFIANHFWLNSFFNIRNRGVSELTESEYSELLQRAGGAFAYSESTPDGAKKSETLFERLGIILTFDRDIQSRSAFFKWYPESLRHHPVTGELKEEKLNLRTTDAEAFCVEIFSQEDVAGFGTELLVRQSYGGVHRTERLLIRGHTWLKSIYPLDQLLPIQPISVERDLDQVVKAYPATLKSLYDANRWQNDTDKEIGLPNQDQADQLRRVLEGFLIQVFSKQESEDARPQRDLYSLQQVTLWSRIVNGSNQFGWIQFLIGIVVCRGLFAAFYSSKDDLEELTAKLAIASLPALGFLGTLLGMALAFARGLEDRNNLTQSLTLAISTSAIALLGALVILWIRGKSD
ncbi:MAG: hypothetical protein JNK90_17185 [Planctomycetaceae bacterium]|nr:hypothetical protein [Planctomycetaceae bacterium]